MHAIGCNRGSPTEATEVYVQKIRAAELQPAFFFFHMLIGPTILFSSAHINLQSLQSDLAIALDDP